MNDNRESSNVNRSMDSRGKTAQGRQADYKTYTGKKNRQTGDL